MMSYHYQADPKEIEKLTTEQLLKITRGEF